jgi:adenosine deaminase CECR1
MIKENVMYAELRPMLLDKSIPAKRGEDTLTIPEQMRLMVDSVSEK